MAAVSRFGVTQAKAQELADRMEACGLLERDIEEHFVRAGGPGGQHVNRTASCVYVRHRPTGLEVKMQQARSQGLNRFYARRRLCELLEERLLGKASPGELKRAKLRKQKARRQRRAQTKSAG